MTPFGAELAEVLQAQCGGRLSAINWFRTDWQRGGALTGYASFNPADDPHSQPLPVVVKLPVPPHERQWLVRLQPSAHALATGELEVVPRLLAHGQTLGGYDLAWVVMERLPHGPLGLAWGALSFDLLIESLGRFYRRTSEYPLDGNGLKRDWEGLLKQARDRVRQGNLPEVQRWKAALKKASRNLENWLELWHGRSRDDLVHGDFHLANAMTRRGPPAGPALLLDLAEVRPGHWIEDAVYLEHLYWATPEALEGRRLCAAIARTRKAHGLTVDANWPQLAQIKRALLAMTTPVSVLAEAGPAHLRAALDVLEREVG